MDRAPCPSDGVLARARGSRSPRRARSLLTYMEQQGLIACHEDVYGNRIITLPALGWETAPGSPDAEEPPAPEGGGLRSEESGVGTECVRQCRSRLAPDHQKQTLQTKP